MRASLMLILICLASINAVEAAEIFDCGNSVTSGYIKDAQGERIKGYAQCLVTNSVGADLHKIMQRDARLFVDCINIIDRVYEARVIRCLGFGHDVTDKLTSARLDLARNYLEEIIHADQFAEGLIEVEANAEALYLAEDIIKNLGVTKKSRMANEIAPYCYIGPFSTNSMIVACNK